MPSEEEDNRFKKYGVKNELIDAYIKEYQHKLQAVTFKILLFGGGFPEEKEQCWKKRYSEVCIKCDAAEKCYAIKRMELREFIKEELVDTAILIEDLEFINPYIDEEIFIQENDDIDLIFIFPETNGSIAEFINFFKNEDVAQKLRIFLIRRYHPLYCDKDSYVRDSYLTHLTFYGHVYLYEDIEELKTLIKRYLENYRRVLYSKNLKK